ncbi:MAG TPA: peptidoglycan editing factor PgeF [Tepidisphaeraceae bacterium]|nr:peptidoglycan editing factor PgeF [Tepidisphaeraceae bacterium]
MLERRIAANGVVYYVSPMLKSSGVPHAFSTRIGGVSPAPFDSLNLGNPSGCATPDPDERVQENYRRLASAAGFVADRHRRCWVHQVHGPEVETVAAAASFENGRPADALATADAGAALAVRVADCVPVLIAGDDGRVVAAAHAGWRGVVGGVVPNAVRTAREIGAADLVAAIGPCIGPDAFEVGPEVAEAFLTAFPAESFVRERGGGKWTIDLRAAVRSQLRASGVSGGRIDSTDRCTVRDGDEFFSHRRDNGITGRMAAMIAPRA